MLSEPLTGTHGGQTYGSINVCDECDPNGHGDAPHGETSSKLRVNNLCCPAEETLIHSALDHMHGVDDVKVNVIGRYAVVKHCPIPCCAPLETIIDKLNEKNLGVSIMEDLGDGEEDEEALDYFAIAQLLFITLFFLIGLVYSLQMGNESMGKNFFYVSIAVGGLLILQKAAFSLYLYRIDISVLMLIAVVGTCALGEFLDGALLLTLYNVAEVLEQNVMRYIRSVIKVSKGAVPQNAFLPSGEKVSVDTLKIGDVIAVRAGNMVAVDGVIVKGEGAFDESALTGEPLPQMKKKGDRAVSGALMQNGYLEIEIDTDVKQSTIRKLNDALLDVQAEKGNYARIVEQFATYWTPLVLTVAIGIFVIGGAVTSDWAKYGEESLTILVLACPCALVMAAPVPAVCAIATAAQNGVLIRGPQAIENGGLITSMAMDKTGTLTTGKYSVVDKLTISTSLEDGYYDPLELAAAIEEKSAHPLADAIVSTFCGCIADFTGKLPNTKKLKAVDGVGLEGWVEVDGDWKFIQVGNERLLDTNGGDVSTDSDVEETINKFVERNESSVILFVCIEDELEMALALSDDVRPETRDAVMALRDIGVDITMLTGDSADVAVVIGEKVQIPASSIHARLMPSEKLDWVKAMESEGKRVAMIGDGINDAAALAGATIGMAMGAGGTAMAASAADLVIMSDNLLRVAQTLTLCRKARAIILQNCVGTVLFKLATLGAAVFGYVPLWAAVLVDVGTLVLVVVNGIRVLDLKRCGCRDDYYSDPEEGGDGSGATLKPIRQAINNPMITGITGGGTHTYDRVINSDAGAVIQGGDMTGDDRL